MHIYVYLWKRSRLRYFQKPPSSSVVCCLSLFWIKIGLGHASPGFDILHNTRYSRYAYYCSP